MSNSIFALLLLSLLTFSNAAPSNIANVDVLVIGGGASGTYAAVRLQQNGKKVVLIERENRLGGHVNTYTDPTTGKTVDYGVQTFTNGTAIQNFFAHFNIPLITPPAYDFVQQTVNFKTGQAAQVQSYSPEAMGAALVAYSQQLAKYPGIAERWDIPSPVPADLLLPFGDFITKYNLQAMALIAYGYNQGMGNMLAQPTLYVMKYFDQAIINGILTGSFVANGYSNNQLLYDRAKNELGANVYLNSNVVSVIRGGNSVLVTVATPSGLKTFLAGKLLLSIPPKLANLPFMDLNANEISIFSQFNNSYFWNGVVLNSGFPNSAYLLNVDPNATLDIAAAPALFQFVDFGDLNNTHMTYYSSPYALSDSQVQSDILQTIGRLQKSYNYTGTPQIVQFNNHSPYLLTVSTQAVQNGFYNRLQALQGQRRTYWTGAAWNKQGTSALYTFTENEILPMILGS